MSPYLQITTKCNMTCRHCMFSCGAVGRHMSLDTVKAACRFAERNGEQLYIGGGEPTCHPQFWEIFGLISAANAEWSADNDIPPVGLVTNGKNTEDALKLAKLAKNGYCSVSLSRDQFHEPIDERVVRAFTKQKAQEHWRSRGEDRDYRDLRSGQIYNIKGTGRGRNLVGATRCDGCGVVIVPSGRIYRCCCRTQLLGSVHDRNLSIDSNLLVDSGCSRDRKRPITKHQGTWMFREDVQERTQGATVEPKTETPETPETQFCHAGEFEPKLEQAANS